MYRFAGIHNHTSWVDLALQVEDDVLLLLIEKVFHRNIQLAALDYTALHKDPEHLPSAIQIRCLQRECTTAL